jgi:RNA polymerase sigma factor (sigma-70 family)
MSSSLARAETSERTFERLYRRHRGDVYRFVLRDLRNPDDAEDVTQAAFLNAYRALQRGSEPEKPRAWLFTIAQNVTRRRFRSRAAHPYEVELDPDALVAPQSEAPSAAEIREALRRLRPNQRAVIVLREIGGLSYAEIAETLGLSVSAVETLLFRSRRALREELAAAEEQPALVRVGGLVLWPLPAALSDTVGSVAAWLGRRALTAKVAGAAGAVVLGTGAAVQAGAIPLPGAERSPELDPPAAVTPVADAPAAAPAGSRVAKPKPDRAPAAGPDRSARERAEPTGDTRPTDLVGELTEAPLAQVPLPQVSVPEVSLPPVSGPAPSVPTLTLPPVPEPTLPETPPQPVLSEPQLPPLPDADDLLP